MFIRPANSICVTKIITIVLRQFWGAEFRNSISFCVISHAFLAILDLVFLRFVNAIRILTYILTISYILNF